MTELEIRAPMQIDDHLHMWDVHTGYFRINMLEAGVLACDIDGTVADLTHRRKYIAAKKSRDRNYPAFEKTMHLDAPIFPIINAVNTLNAYGWTVVMCSGRGSQNRQVTLDWLNEHGVLFDHLYMRAEKDYRKDYIIKSELLDQIIDDGLTPKLVFDDRNQVVEMWRDRGIPCVQVAPGDF